MKNPFKLFYYQKNHPHNSADVKDYQDELWRIRKVARSWNLTEKQINCVMEKSMQSVLPRSHVSAPRLNESKFQELGLYFLKLFFQLIFFIVSAFLVLYILLQHKPTQYFVQSRLQDCIYPGMKLLRKLSLPIILSFPSLTDFYDESCLVSNPFFRVSNLPCPCENVRAILNLTGEDTSKEQYHSGIPYILKVKREEVTWKRLRALYHQNNFLFDQNANQVTVSSYGSDWQRTVPSSLFSSDWLANDTQQAFTHVVWRSNRMEPTRVLRSLFGLPVGDPNYAAGITIEKLVVIDGPKALSHALPTTEGTTVFIHQSSGSRLIVLTPTRECSHRCSPVSVLLPSSHILWFSWWYWRASSLPSPTTSSLSIEYVGSHW